MNNLKVFEFEKQKIRTEIIDNEPWFVVKDICTILDIISPTVAMSRIGTDDSRLIKVTHPQSPDKTIEVNSVNESGLYSLIFLSVKPEAKKFQKWVTSEVLPSIRKTGQYNIQDRKKFIAMALIEAQKEIEELTPKAEFYDRVMSSKDLLSFSEVAKTLGIKGAGRNKMMMELRQKGILNNNNIPYQEYINRGYFEVKESVWIDNNNDNHISLTTKITQKGLDYLKTVIEKWVRL